MRRLTAMTLSMIILGLVAGLTGCTEEPIVADPSISNPYPSNGATGVDPGEPGFRAIDDIPSGMLALYGDSLVSNVDQTFFWFDFNGNDEWDEGPRFTWTVSGPEPYTNYLFFGYDPDSLEQFIEYSDLLLHRPPLLPDTTVYWQVAVQPLGTWSFDASEAMMGPIWSFRTSGYDLGE